MSTTVNGYPYGPGQPRIHQSVLDLIPDDALSLGSIYRETEDGQRAELRRRLADSAPQRLGSFRGLQEQGLVDVETPATEEQ